MGACLLVGLSGRHVGDTSGVEVGDLGGVLFAQLSPQSLSNCFEAVGEVGELADQPNLFPGLTGDAFEVVHGDDGPALDGGICRRGSLFSRFVCLDLRVPAVWSLSFP